ncbi:2Fe-2S iron-sulfur cluster binding domain-containing protein [Salmonella enterica]|nr:2Fe-2S iron-sulfur cluster binding domain-containing protein [Salmonella enterica]EKO0998100.1 2Fe-2S iron-sulfur cluster binding domain-containing protein [Salmonella enterica subsp. enterica]ELS3675975.1 2Fe-2S iron-sulfur cluster binding domain-containing protein [Salmonella enterica]
MTMPASQCPWRMQVHHIRQETPDVWTIALLCHDYYPYRAGQYALESNKVPVAAACRAGVCGCCKTKVVSGDYTVSSTMTLSEAEIAEGYVLACSCHPQGDLVLA